MYTYRPQTDYTPPVDPTLLNGGALTPDEVAAHNHVLRIHHQNIATLQNPPAPQPIAAGIGATALGALGMTKAGVQVPVLMLNPLGR